MVRKDISNELPANLWRTSLKKFRPLKGSGIEKGIRTRHDDAQVLTGESPAITAHQAWEIRMEHQQTRISGDQQIRMESTATYLQAFLRGAVVRRQHKTAHSAARRIQARLRGMQARIVKQRTFLAAEQRRRNCAADRWLKAQEKLSTMLVHTWRRYKRQRIRQAAWQVEAEQRAAAQDTVAVTKAAAAKIQQHWRAHKRRKDKKKSKRITRRSDAATRKSHHLGSRHPLAINYCRHAVAADLTANIEEESEDEPEPFSGMSLFLTAVSDAMVATKSNIFQPETISKLRPESPKPAEQPAPVAAGPKLRQADTETPVSEEVKLWLDACATTRKAHQAEALHEVTRNTLLAALEVGILQEAVEDAQLLDQQSSVRDDLSDAWSVSTPDSEIDDAISDIATDDEADATISMAAEVDPGLGPGSGFSVAPADTDEDFLRGPTGRDSSVEPEVYESAVESPLRQASMPPPEMPAHVAAALSGRLDRLMSAEQHNAQVGNQSSPRRNRFGFGVPAIQEAPAPLPPLLAERPEQPPELQPLKPRHEPRPPQHKPDRHARRRVGPRARRLQPSSHNVTSNSADEADKMAQRMLPFLSRPGVKAESILPALDLRRNRLGNAADKPPHTQAAPRSVASARGKEQMPSLSFLPARYKMAVDRVGIRA